MPRPHQQSVGRDPGPGMYKEEPAPVADPHHPHPHPPGSLPPHLQQSRPSSIVHQIHHPNSPHPPAGHFPSPHSQNHGLPLQHQASYHQPHSGPNGHPENPYYSQPTPYGTPVSTQYSTGETPDLMAAASMQQRPYQPVYHTPQSNSPASVASSQSHDPNGRLYSQQTQQMQQPLYGYPQYQTPINQNYPAAYAQHASQQQPQPPPPQQHPAMTSQPQMMMPHQQQPQQQGQQPPMQHQQQQQQQHQPPMQHQQPHPQPPEMAANSPRTKLEPAAIQQRPLDPNSHPQRPAPGPISSGHNPPSGPQTNGQLNPGQAGRSGNPAGNSAANGQNPNAAPGPIPATTPTVVRQDQNGVQWIAFEYSRDRVKMEYTIRCDVESVNVDQLVQEFRSENCVYPRACCGKEQYRGNRLNYETECNTVGWALAELNPCLRGKRGLIQRAVDSWRNSNQDPRLRSRRVRRQAKIQTRKQVQAPHPSHLAGPGGPGVGGGGPTGVTPGPTPMAAPVQRPRQPSSMIMGSSQTHHHHAHPDGSAPGGSDEVSANGNFTPQGRQHQSLPKQASPNDVRQHQVFHGYSHYPTQAGSGGIALTPSLHDGIDGPLSAHPNVHPSNPSAVAASVPMTTKVEDSSHDDQSKEFRAPSAASTNVFGDLPEAKRRKFILVEDLDRKTRIRATLDTVDTSEIPDSYRKTNSVYPRSYYPIYMQSPKRRASRGNRFFEDDDGHGSGGKGEHGEGESDEEAVMGRTLVPVPTMEGHEGELAVPKIGRAKRRREEQVNDLGYRMAWSQSRIFDKRPMFLQRALDTYRNKITTTLIAGGQPVAAHLETRIGKRKWSARKGKTRLKSEG